MQCCRLACRSHSCFQGSREEMPPPSQDGVWLSAHRSTLRGYEASHLYAPSMERALLNPQGPCSTVLITLVQASLGRRRDEIHHYRPGPVFGGRCSGCW